MSGYLREKTEKDGKLLTWQTPDRQRLWGIAVALVATALIVHSLSNLSNINVPELILGLVVMIGALLVATYTVRFQLNLKYGTYQNVKGFLPAFFWGDRGRCQDSFQCIAIRKETLLDAAKHENDPLANDFDQYTISMVWKAPGKEAMLIDTRPLTYEESLKKTDFHQESLDHAHEIADQLNLEVLDQTITHAVIETPEEQPATQKEQTTKPTG